MNARGSRKKNADPNVVVWRDLGFCNSSKLQMSHFDPYRSGEALKTGNSQILAAAL